jgi:serine/threonine protein kinase
MIIRNHRITRERKYFILEKEKYGNIYDYIFYKNQGLGEPCSKILFQKILIGFQCLHKHNICHRDIKLDNILLDENFSPKICDFGFACFNSSKLVFKGGTDNYKPPEANGITEYDGIKGDIFYLASVLMILTTGMPAFNFPNKLDIYFKKIIYKKYDLYWNKIGPKIKQKGITISPEFQDFFNKIVCYDPNERLNIDQMLEHPWFKDINEMKENNIEEFKKKEEEIRDLFTELVPLVQQSLAAELKNKDAESVYASYNRGISENIGIFNSDAKPKMIDTPMNIKYCINIKGNLDPVSFMNKLYAMIKSEFEIECSITADDPEILKMRVFF